MEDNYMSFWRKCISFVFMLFLPLCAVGVFVFAVIAMTELDIGGWGLLIMLGGELSVAILGMFIELCNNIADIRDKTCESTTPQNIALTQNTASMLSKLRTTNGNGVLEDFWYCEECGTANDRLSSYCQQCGKYK